jgi:hypothetical protein
MTTAAEQQIEDLKNAKTKQALFEVASKIANEGHNIADPEMLADITLKLRSCANANSPPEFAIPFSVQLAIQMGKDLGPGWYIAVSCGAWPKIISDSQAASCIDHVTSRSRVLAGHMGVLFGVDIFTDAYYHPELQVLARDLMYVMSADGAKGYAVRLA